MANAEAVQNAQAITYQATGDGRFECLVCPHKCKLRAGQTGVCQVRQAGDGINLRAYGKISHAAVEPIEKKPIYHYKPNLRTLSIGGYGCSMACSFCQNWMVSQKDDEQPAASLSPQQVVDLAVAKNCLAVCFTYNEPIVYFEYILDLGLACKSKGLELILKTNAFAELPIWAKLCEVASAMNIDWKGNEQRYQSVARAFEKPVLDCIDYAVSRLHVEISIPVYHDATVGEHLAFAEFMSKTPLVPLHLLKIYPAYKDVLCQVTSDGLLQKIAKLYSSKSKHVYQQSVYSQDGLQNTKCPNCNETIAVRESLTTEVRRVDCCNCPIIVA
jgi:pyruvate formate lyase activating enzyme